MFDLDLLSPVQEEIIPQGLAEEAFATETIVSKTALVQGPWPAQDSLSTVDDLTDLPFIIVQQTS